MNTIWKNKFFEFLSNFYLIQGLIRSYIPFMSISGDYSDRIIFPLIPKFSSDGEMFWFRKCVKRSYNAIEIGIYIYDYENVEEYLAYQKKINAWRE